ncbi:MAG: ribosome-binding factor A [Desulfobacterales bacterium CG07_land_8_20_14_0_80_52_14]|nr:MAG: ribosome-binding factor A [Desulfobacterales bacterium CG23_combo_of_CG06-09_8_20_14_all_52_9]PIU50195.1 MAG: ribosome-binding factor A [Desulfobacterales bacterium CG07_land_8_20_14_0_80_52_14]
MKPFRRADRVAAQIQKILSEILQKEIQDPRLKMVTITRVKLTSDLKFARIYFASISGEERKVTIAAGFKDASGYIKRALSGRLGLRYMPDLQFFYDESYDHASKIFRILKALETDNGDHGTDHRQTEEQ